MVDGEEEDEEDDDDPGFVVGLEGFEDWAWYCS